MRPVDPQARASSGAAGREVGRYLLCGEIASGGMATVHFGRLSGPVGFSRTVAIKRLHPQYARDPELVTMFLDEARLAGRIRHPNVVPTLDVVATEGEIFLVMDYVQGEWLSRLARSMKTQNERIPPRLLATVMSGVLHGLHAAHEAKDEQGHPLSIVHRDVSPQNILVGTDGTARVLDFGVAKAAGRLQSTREGQIKGKISYMAPEQLSGGDVTRATDVYAAAVVLWECLVGQRLFDGDNEAMIVVRALEGRVELPSALVPGLPAELDAVVMRGLARDPAQRFTTAREMALALERAFGVVAPSEIGEWVEAIAGAELTKRAATVAEIESSSVTAVSDGKWTDPRRRGPQHDEPHESRHPRPGLPRGMHDGGSQVSSISVSRNGRSEREPDERRHRLSLVILVTAVVALATALGVVLALGRAGGASKVAAAGGQAAAATAAPSAPASSMAASPLGADAAAPARAESVAASPTAPSTNDAPPRASPPPVAGAAKTRRLVESPAHRADKKAASDASCDPPYTVDDQGHKMYKLECLSP